MNVHVSQLKPIGNNLSENHGNKGVMEAAVEPSGTTKTSVMQDHYLEDFDEDEFNAPVVENHVVEANFVGDGMVVVLCRWACRCTVECTTECT